MSGTINQSSIEAVFEDVMNNGVEKMTEEDREDARKFHLSEAVRFGAVDYLEGRDYIPSRTDEEIEGMSRVEKMFMQQYYLTEAKRFGADESYTIHDPEEEDEEARPRPTPAPEAEVDEYHDEEREYFSGKSAEKCSELSESIISLKEEIAQIEKENSLNREHTTLMKNRNILMKEEKLIHQEMLAAEKEWGEMDRVPRYER